MAFSITRYFSVTRSGAFSLSSRCWHGADTRAPLVHETGHNGEKYRNYFALHEISNYSSVFIHVRGKRAFLVISSIMWSIYHILFTALCMVNFKLSEGLCRSSVKSKPMFSVPMSYRNRLRETLANKCSRHVPSGGYSDEPSCLSSLTANCPVRTHMESFSPNHKVVGDHPVDTKFFLFTNNNPFNPENIHDCGGKLPLNSNFNPHLKTEVFVHGFSDGVCKRAWLREMKEQVLFRGRYNVILVDWSWGSKDGDRSIAVENVKVVGEHIAFVINNIIKQTKGNESKFHLIGHSLGAHGSGFAGKQLSGLGRITALDPSRSPYEELPPNERLHQSDANIVDVIHTSAYGAGGKGFREPIGDADFYPNGPCKQSVNEQEVSRSFTKLDHSYGQRQLDPDIYNHLISIQYYMSSINPIGCKFIGEECESYKDFRQGNCKSGANGQTRIMGMDFELPCHEKDGRYHKYYLDTHPTCPYCRKY